MVQNGLIPTSAMTKLSVGGFLLPNAARNFELWRQVAANAGYTLTITSAADAFRSYEVQERIFLSRYSSTHIAGRPTKYWRNRTWWLKPGMATAAVPGTSNHGLGIAVDIRNAGAFTGPFYRWMAATGPALGWPNAEGRSINEPWHWVNDNAQRGAIGNIPGATPDKKGFLMTLSDEKQEDLYRRMVNVDAWIHSGGAGVQAGQAENGTLAQRIINLDRQVTGAQGNNVNLVDAIGILIARTNDVQRSEARPLRQEIADTLTAVLDVQAKVTAIAQAPGTDVDETALASALAPLLTAATPTLSDADLERVSKVVTDEVARRLTGK